MKQSVLSAREVCKSFASNGVQNHVLSQVELDIYQKEFTVIMGASGSGKSTLLYALSGMDSVTSGKIAYLDKCLSDMQEKQLTQLRKDAFGFIFQQMHLVGNLTLFENIAVSGYLSKKEGNAAVKKRTLKLLDKMHLSEAANRLPAQVSGGEQQRAAIARAIIHRPDILFADEPTGALNRKNTTAVLDLLTDLHQEGQTILMVTHDVKAAIRADRILYLEDGRILSELVLSSYKEEERKSRETQVNAWLASMEW